MVRAVGSTAMSLLGNRQLYERGKTQTGFGRKGRVWVTWREAEARSGCSKGRKEGWGCSAGDQRETGPVGTHTLTQGS